MLASSSLVRRAKQAAADGLEYFWIDTSCIDKKSAVELSAAINSMFRWYQNAVRCYVYLSDVSKSDTGADGQRSSEEAIRKSRRLGSKSRTNYCVDSCNIQVGLQARSV